eukprot:1175363-Prorocentrum_minimum.AAC.1
MPAVGAVLDPVGRLAGGGLLGLNGQFYSAHVEPYSQASGAHRGPAPTRITCPYLLIFPHRMQWLTGKPLDAVAKIK